MGNNVTITPRFELVTGQAFSELLVVVYLTVNLHFRSKSELKLKGLII